MRFKPIHPDTAARRGNRIYPQLSHLLGIGGAYVLKFPSGGYYVGSSHNLYVRLVRHSNRHSVLQLQYAAFPTPRHREMEQQLISALRHRGKTIFNVVNAVGAPYQKRARKWSLHAECKRRGVAYQAVKSRLRAGAANPFKKAHKTYKRWITIGGRTRPMVFWCRRAGISQECAQMRIREGWTEQDAVSIPPKRGRT